MTDMAPAELQKQRMLNPDRFDQHPKVRLAIRDYVAQMRQNSDPMDMDQIAYTAKGQRTEAVATKRTPVGTPKETENKDMWKREKYQKPWKGSDNSWEQQGGRGHAG